VADAAPVMPLAKILRDAAFQPPQHLETAKMPRPLTPEQLLTPVPSDIAISDAIAPLPITEIAEAAGIVRIVDYCKILSSIAGGTGALH
jgi:hypothetical protein